MTLISLQFLACLAAAPTTCERVELLGQGSLQACLLAAQPQIAAWLQEHPGRVLRGGVRCSVGVGS